MRRRGFLLVVAVVAIAGCSRREPLVLQRDGAKRIVSLAPSMTEALFAIGAGDRVVGRSRFCDFPPEAHALPIVGGVEPDLEVVLDLRPDLVVGISGMSSTSLAEKLAARGIATWLPDTNSLAMIDAVLVGLGERTGHALDARRLVEGLDSGEQAIERSIAREPRPRVLMVVSLGPVVAAGPNSFADELIRDAGGYNVVAEGGGWQVLGFERIADLDPDVLLDATAAGADRATAITSETAGWSGVRAVREGHVVLIRDERVLRAGPRIADGLAVLARALHPHAAVP
jgi:iron complex transport system substrate-binding protein